MDGLSPAGTHASMRGETCNLPKPVAKELKLPQRRSLPNDGREHFGKSVELLH